MGIVRADALLKTYILKLRMAEDGTTHPRQTAKLMFIELVDKLSQLPADELIEIDAVQGRQSIVRFIRVSTGTTIVELHEEARQ